MENSQHLLKVLDLLVHDSTTGRDMESAVNALRRLLKGKNPSEVLTPTSDLEPRNGYYSRVQFKMIISTLFIKDHGVAQALAQKNAAQRQQGLDIPKIDISLLQKWRKEDGYPAWVVDQLRQLTANDLLKTYRWTQENREFMLSTYDANPNISNHALADLCSQKFGHPVTDGSIRGTLHRALRLRPGRATSANVIRKVQIITTTSPPPQATMEGQYAVA